MVTLPPEGEGSVDAQPSGWSGTVVSVQDQLVEVAVGDFSDVRTIMLPYVAAAGTPQVDDSCVVVFTEGQAVAIFSGETLLSARSSVTPKVALVEWFGHSYAYGTGAVRDQDGFVDRLSYLLGAARRNNRGWQGASAAWRNSGVSGDGGYVWAMQGMTRPGMTSINPDARGAPYVPRSQVVGFTYGINDIARMGGLRSATFVEAMRTMLAAACTAAVWRYNDASVGYVGTWADSTSGNDYSEGVAHYTATVGDKVTLTIPTDFPGNRTIHVVMPMVAGTQTITVGVKVDGVAQPDIVLDASVCTDTVNTKPGAQTIRFDPADYPALQTGLKSDGTRHTIELTYKATSVVNSLFMVDRFGMETDPAEGPVLVVHNVARCPSYAAYTYSASGDFRHGVGAPSDAISDAAVATYNEDLATMLEAEFAGRYVLVDIDSVLGKAAANFAADNLHPNALGHALVAEETRRALLDSGLLTSLRMSRAVVDVASFFEPVGTAQRIVYTNGWVSNAAGVGAGYHRFLNGVVEVRGQVKSGSSATAPIFTLSTGYRPDASRYYPVVGSGTAVAVVQIVAGVVSTNIGGITALEFLDGITFSASP